LVAQAVAIFVVAFEVVADVMTVDVELVVEFAVVVTVVADSVVVVVADSVVLVVADYAVDLVVVLTAVVAFVAVVVDFAVEGAVFVDLHVAFVVVDLFVAFDSADLVVVLPVVEYWIAEFDAVADFSSAVVAVPALVIVAVEAFGLVAAVEYLQSEPLVSYFSVYELALLEVPVVFADQAAGFG
jgi:hypothetical protein